MEEFFTLRAEKQNHIIDAALTVFGRNGYKKSSIADIAEKAHIAKGMVIYYFGSKKNLYLYCAELCGDLLEKEMEKGFDPTVKPTRKCARSLTSFLRKGWKSAAKWSCRKRTHRVSRKI